MSDERTKEEAQAAEIERLRALLAKERERRVLPVVTGICVKTDMRVRGTTGGDLGTIDSESKHILVAVRSDGAAFYLTQLWPTTGAEWKPTVPVPGTAAALDADGAPVEPVAAP